MKSNGGYPVKPKGIEKTSKNVHEHCHFCNILIWAPNCVFISEQKVLNIEKTAE
jgi:hypothetical protein